ncbi:hypothetical protein [Swingsia samuiensis]|uniref:Uncharacterized protein n=1 Tax=Swingsia samuiensis TaxID=1293412 RepID=A0A4Y6UKK0_9PROT|nr:hypothetical protein [Swingsia samuiensis]QDH16996.1 hypothetical protein E3D00_05035 [Swingsia samuiensis]
MADYDYDYNDDDYDDANDEGSNLSFNPFDPASAKNFGTALASSIQKSIAAAQKASNAQGGGNNVQISTGSTKINATMLGVSVSVSGTAKDPVPTVSAKGDTLTVNGQKVDLHLQKDQHITSINYNNGKLLVNGTEVKFSPSNKSFGGITIDNGHGTISHIGPDGISNVNLFGGGNTGISTGSEGIQIGNDCGNSTINFGVINGQNSNNSNNTIFSLWNVGSVDKVSNNNSIIGSENIEFGNDGGNSTINFGVINGQNSNNSNNTIFSLWNVGSTDKVSNNNSTQKHSSTDNANKSAVVGTSPQHKIAVGNSHDNYVTFTS